MCWENHGASFGLQKGAAWCLAWLRHVWDAKDSLRRRSRSKWLHLRWKELQFAGHLRIQEWIVLDQSNARSLALLTCMATRAVHFEVLRSMDSSSFIDALQQFRARKPAVRRLFSDCGSNFTAAEKEIAAEVAAWNALSMEDLRLLGIE